MKKIILVAVVAMLSFSSFAEEVYDVDGLAIECNSELELSADVDATEAKTDNNGSTKE